MGAAALRLKRDASTAGHRLCRFLPQLDQQRLKALAKQHFSFSFLLEPGSIAIPSRHLASAHWSLRADILQV